MKELLNAMPTEHQPERKQEIDAMRSASEYTNFLKHRLSNTYDMIRVMSVKGRVSDTRWTVEPVVDAMRDGLEWDI
jgi:hypothetical protein